MPDLRLSASTLALMAALALPGIANAQDACTPAAPNDGDVVTCTGIGTGILDDGLDDAQITVLEGAEITGTDQGFEFDDDVTFINHGVITGQGDHGVQGDNGVSVTNYGTITGDGDGVNIDNDGRLVNAGTIIGGDDGVQLEDNAYVMNTETGIIRAADEGVNINTDGAQLYNYGLIEAGDDGVNAADDAYIYNAGTIRSTGDQDGVDLDSGTVINDGLIISDGVEDGIDFDPSTQDSLVQNTGTIEGTIGINTDGADTGAQRVVNSGTIRGRGGVALNLGMGDDTLEVLRGSIIDGLIEMGDGTDTVMVQGVQAGMLRFGSLPEVVSFDGPGLLVGTALALIDPMPLAAGDRLARSAAFGVAGVVHDRQGQGGAWLGVFGGGSDIAASGSYQGLSERSGGLVAGQSFGTVSGFLAVTQGRATLDDGEHRLRQTALFVGLSHLSDLGDAGTLSALGYLGRTDTDLTSPAYRSGDAQMDGTVIGASLRFARGFGGQPDAPFADVALQADVVHHRTGGYTLSGLGGGTIAAHDATAYGLRADLGLPVAVGGGVLRPYVFAALRGGDQGVMQFGLSGGSTSFAAPNLFDDSHAGIGLSYVAQTGPGALRAGIEYAGNADDRQMSLRVSFDLAL